MSRRELRRAGERIAVEPQVFDLLVFLIENRDRVVSKDDLIAAVWKGRIVSESTLTSRINAARRALGDSGEAQRLIHTVQRKGFRFIGTLRKEAASAPTAEPAPIETSTPPAIAVLPFANMGGDPEQEYFADGITEDIITALSKWRSFLVIARNSVFTYKGRSVDVREVGRELGARYVLEGSVRKAGNRLRITAQLIDASNAAHLWAERYDRDLTDVFSIQEEISQQIAIMVEPELTRHERKLSTAKPPANLEAWDCLHRGMHHFYKNTKADNEAARSHLERAVELDPQFSRAYTNLARTYQSDLLLFYAADRPTSIARLLNNARRAVQLDDGDSHAHVMLCFAYRWRGELDLAIAEGRRAVELNRCDVMALGTLGLMLDLAGESHEGLACLQRALVLNPRDLRAKYVLALTARACIVIGDYAAADSWARKAIESDPLQPRSHLFQAAALGHLGRAKEARAAFDTCERLQPGFAANWIGLREYRNPASDEHFIEGLRKAGLKLK